MLVVCYAVTAFRKRNTRLWVLIFNYVYVVNKLVLIFEYTCILLYFLSDVLACFVGFMALRRMFGMLC
jgi:hypothetical protein